MLFLKSKTNQRYDPKKKKDKKCFLAFLVLAINNNNPIVKNENLILAFLVLGKTIQLSKKDNL